MEPMFTVRIANGQSPVVGQRTYRDGEYVTVGRDEARRLIDGGCAVAAGYSNDPLLVRNASADAEAEAEAKRFGIY